MRYLLILLFLHAALHGVCTCCYGQAAPAMQSGAGLTSNDVLSVRDGRFFLDGRPFAEVSFNKFDLLWQLYDQLAAGRPLDEANPMVQAQEKALRNLRELGFRSIRLFALPWGPSGRAAYENPLLRTNLFAAMDKVLELCDRSDMRVVWSLSAGVFTDLKIVPGKGWVYGEEHERELMADPGTRGRRLLYAYVDDVVGRYRWRKAIMMWEVSNELNLSADIGDNAGPRMPTLKHVAGFLNDVAGRIKAADPLRLVNSGGSNMRECQWNLYKGQGWKIDTLEEQFKCFELLYAGSAIDVIDVHLYPNNRPGFVIAGADGRPAVLDVRGYVAIAARLGKPLMIGELGLQPSARSEKAVWAATPDYFESYADTVAARPWVEKTLNAAVDAGVQLAYWWCYQSDRPWEKEDRQRFDLERGRNPELLECFVKANRRLKARLGAE